MAKALLGYVSTQYDPREAARFAAENRRLRQQLADLQSLVRRLQHENDLLTDRLDPSELLVPSQGAAVEDMQPV
jgi:hypothetical protein